MDAIGPLAAVLLEAAIVFVVWRIFRLLMRTGRVHIAGNWPTWLVGGQPDIDPTLTTRPAGRRPKRRQERARR